MTNSTSPALRGFVATTLLAAALCASNVAHAQTISTIAGNGSPAYSGDGGPATNAGMVPLDVAVDAAGNRYIADLNNDRIRKVTPTGVISTVAGNGVNGFSGDGGPATSASISYVLQLAVDAGGTLYLADYGNNRVRKVTPAGVISTIAGNGTYAFSGDGGPATSASLRGPVGIAVDSVGNVFFSDYDNQRIRKVTPTGVISTVAGNGSTGFSGDGGPATTARLYFPRGISVDASGNLYIADGSNSRVRKVTASGIISTIAGNGSQGFSGDGGPATSASLNGPCDVAADSGGNVYIADLHNHRVRKVSPGGVISTIAGNGVPAFAGDGGPATSASLYYPYGVTTTAIGDLYIADYGNYRVRTVDLFTTCAAESYTGAKLTLCQRVCEFPQSPSTLTNLITLYTAIYRSAPPCAR